MMKKISFMVIVLSLLWTVFAAPQQVAAGHDSGLPGGLENPVPKIVVSPTPAPVTQPTKQVAPVNPLTGLPVDNPELLNNSPVMVSVSNFPISVRPQGGLSFAPHVFEMTIGEGMTRFLAVFYGNYGDGTPDQANENLASIRSGRVPYEGIRTMYDGMIVMAGADPKVAKQLNATVFRQKVDFSDIQELAEERSEKRGAPVFEDLNFDSAVPAGGVSGENLEIIWSYLNRVRWTYDTTKGAYLREQDKSDGKGTYFPATDKLTGEQLAFNNVVLLYAPHTYESPTIIEMEMLYIKKMPAIFFRDGKAYKVFWTSIPLGPFRFFYEDGTPFPYKPGNTFYEVISNINQAQQSADGSWKVKFFNP